MDDAWAGAMGGAWAGAMGGAWAVRWRAGAVEGGVDGAWMVCRAEDAGAACAPRRWCVRRLRFVARGDDCCVLVVADGSVDAPLQPRLRRAPLLRLKPRKLQRVAQLLDASFDRRLNRRQLGELEAGSLRVSAALDVGLGARGAAVQSSTHTCSRVLAFNSLAAGAWQQVSSEGRASDEQKEADQHQ
eukprot:6163109-Pleurochrysis_carterae.AAC.1